MLRESTGRDEPNRTKIGPSYQLFEVLSVMQGGCKKKRAIKKVIGKIGRANFREKCNNLKCSFIAYLVPDLLDRGPCG